MSDINVEIKMKELFGVHADAKDMNLYNSVFGSLPNPDIVLQKLGLGISAYYDVGRVWVENDLVDKWASGYGLGVWVSPLRRLLFSFVYAMSKEDKLPLVTLGWRF